MDLKKSVSIIIPNYNGRQLLEEYLPYTLHAVNNSGTDYEIILVDDCSTDGSAAFIRSFYPNLTLITNSENKGFSYTCNSGIAVAKCQLILLLNSDVKLSPDYFEHLWKYFTRWDTFGVMGRIMDMEGDHIQDAARVPRLNGFKLKTDYFYFTGNGKNRLLTFYLSGANALIDAEKLKKIGGFYEIFSPFYSEDMELSLRAWRMNWRCYYEHSAVCRHKLSASTNNYQTPARLKMIKARNRFYVHAIHLNGIALRLWYLQIIAIDLLPKLLSGQGWVWEAYRELFKNKPLIDGYKKQVAALQDENDSQVTVFNVVDKIRASVKNKKLSGFKP